MQKYYRFLYALLAMIVTIGAFLLGCTGGGGSSSGGGSASQTCNHGEVLNYFASNIPSAYCPSKFPYYCNGTGKCYDTWEHAYYGNPCTLPQGRTAFLDRSNP